VAVRACDQRRSRDRRAQPAVDDRERAGSGRLRGDRGAHAGVDRLAQLACGGQLRAARARLAPGRG